MVKQVLKYFPEEKTILGRLFLEIGHNQLALWMLESTDETLVAFELYSIVQGDDWFGLWEKIGQQSTLLKNVDTVEKVTLIWQSEVNVVVPELTNYPEDEMYSLLGSIKEKSYPLKNGVHENYGVEGTTYAFFDQLYPGARHISKSGAIRKILSGQILYNDLAIHVLYQYESCYVAVVKHGEVLSVMKHSFVEALDPVYYILNAARQTEIDINICPVVVSGLIDEDSTLYTELYKFVPNVQFDSVTENMLVVTEENALPEHYLVPFIKYAL